jgi:hypothetical protein
MLLVNILLVFLFLKILEKVKNFNGFKVKLLFRRFYIDFKSSFMVCYF